MCKTFSALTFLLFGNENQNYDINISFKSANWCCSIMSHLCNTELLQKKNILMVIIGTMGIGLQVLLYPRNIGKSSKSSGWILWAGKVNCVFFQHLEFPAETAQGSSLRYSLSALTALNTVVYCISCWIANGVTAFSHLIPDLVCNQKLIWEVLHMTCVRTQA